jgi:hypothetical protein
MKAIIPTAYNLPDWRGKDVTHAALLAIPPRHADGDERARRPSDLGEMNL